MSARNVESAINEGLDALEERGILLSFCQLSEAMHATLTHLARNSGTLKAIVLRAVCGWITEARKQAGCIEK
jgi:hypothetical protein